MYQMLRHAYTGMQLRCPNCCRGRIYSSFSRLNPACPVCGVRFEREEGDFLGAMLIAYSVTSLLVVVGVLLTAALTDLSLTGHLTLWALCAVLFLTLTYRNMKGIWIGILHRMVGLRPGEAPRETSGRNQE